jgi:putative ABC transport system permease protein
MAAPTALLRVARRAFLRDRWRAILIVVLIALPVAGITTAALVLETAVPTKAERATQRMGMADLRLTPNGPYGRTELTTILPSGSVMEPIWMSGDRTILDGVDAPVNAWSLDAGGLAAGMVILLDGALPASPDEVAISEALAVRAGVTIGGTLRLEEAGQVRVVGLVEDPRSMSRLLVVGDPSLALAGDRVPEWLVAIPAGIAEEAVASDVRSAIDPAFADLQQPMFEPITRADASEASGTFTAIIVLLGALALVESALVAAAAFAVGIRRRQRELGLLGAVGSTPRQLAGSVLAEGLVAGIVAVALGVVVGLALAALIATRLDDMTGSRAGSLELDPGILLLAGVVGLAAALIAAAVPAWGASRLPTLVALSGRRPPTTPARRLLLVGIGLVVLAFAVTAIAPVIGRGSDVLPLLLLVVGAVTGVLGFGACSPWLLERLEGVAGRLPLSPRVALRDTARARTRNGPIVTAGLASVAATVALAAVMASQQARVEAEWRSDMAADSLVVRGSSPETAGPAVARELGAIGYGADGPAWTPRQDAYYDVTMPLQVPSPDDDLIDRSFDIHVGDEAYLTALRAEAGLDAFRAGSVVVLAPADDPRVTGSVATVGKVAFDERGESTRTELGAVPAVVIAASPVVPTGPMAVMSAAVAESLGLELDTGHPQYLVRLDHDVTRAEVDRAGVIALAVDPDSSVSGPLPPSDGTMGFRALLLAAAILGALTVTGIAVALGETEARGDQRTLLALGAARSIRRRITASRALVIAALAGVLAVPAGLLPVWGVLTSLDWPVVVPVPEVIGALVILPLAAVAGGLLLGRPLPEWAARRDPGI